MGRNHNRAARQHNHCAKCFSQHCKAPIEISVSCVIINCRLFCGAVFHLCKEEEHQLLCPNETVPCLNVGYGCPFTMWRCKLAQHLEVCPASVVSCSMEWNRWPIETDTIFYDNVLKETYSDEQLDLSLALRDQNNLFSSMKMKTIFAELVKKTEGPMPSELKGAVGGCAVSEVSVSFSEPPDEEMDDLTQEQREALARSNTVPDIGNYSLWEKMFSMELSGCKETIKALDSNEKPDFGKNKKESESSQVNMERQEPETSTNQNDHVSSQTRRLDQTKDINSFQDNSYHVHYGCRQIETGKQTACITKNNNFVYGYLEPMKIKTVRTFKVPTSFTAKHGRIRNPSICKKASKSVDTSDLGVSLEDIPKWDEAQATLLCCLEREMQGHQISKTVSADALLTDVGTQTYDFPSVPFQPEASLAEITSNRALKLHFRIEAEAVTRTHNKVNSVFTFLCTHFFRRDEFSSHFKNVHADIQSSLDGWFEQRCPLAYLGCTYSQKRFQPYTQRATVRYNQDLSTFTLRPEVPALISRSVKILTQQKKHASKLDVLSRLPLEILVHIASFLDSFTLSQLAMVSKLMRAVCATLLHDRGFVSLKWEKKTYSHGGSAWRSKQKVWQFSNAFSSVDRWRFGDIPSMSEHLRLCPFYQTEMKSEPVALVRMHDGKIVRKVPQSLVAMFLGNTSF